VLVVFFFFQAEDGIRDRNVTGVQTCALPIWECPSRTRPPRRCRCRIPCPRPSDPSSDRLRPEPLRLRPRRSPSARPGSRRRADGTRSEVRVALGPLGGRPQLVELGVELTDPVEAGGMGLPGRLESAQVLLFV